jgi:hypothetical protein
MKAILTILFIVTISIFSGSCRRESFSPSQTGSFIKFFAHSTYNEGIGVRSTGNGFVLAGTVTTESSGSNIILIRTDEYGNERGRKQFGGMFDDRVNSIIVLSDGGFAILGSTTVQINENSFITDMYLIRTDSQGNEIWAKSYGEKTNEIGYSLCETSDGGFILLGSTEVVQTGSVNIYMVKTNSEGDVMWERTHGGLFEDVGLNIIETDYGYIYTGYTRSYPWLNQAYSNIFIVKTNSLGRVTYPFTYGSSGDDLGKSIFAHEQGGYVVLGTTTNTSSVKNIYLSRIEENISVPLWTKTFGDDINHVAECMKVTPDGNYVITGTQELSDENHVIFLLKTDPEGNPIFFETYGGSGRQRGKAVDIASDGGYIITGSNESGGVTLITLIKTNADGKL